MGVFLAAIPHAVRLAAGAGKTGGAWAIPVIGATGAATQVAPSGVKFDLPELKGAGRVNEPHFSQTPQRTALHANSGRGNTLLSGGLFSWGGKGKSASDSGGNQPGGPVGDPGGQGPKWSVPVLGTALTASLIDNVLVRTTGKGILENISGAFDGMFRSNDVAHSNVPGYENKVVVDFRLEPKSQEDSGARFDVANNTEVVVTEKGIIPSNRVYVPAGSKLELQQGGTVGTFEYRRVYADNVLRGTIVADGGDVSVDGSTANVVNRGGTVTISQQASVRGLYNESGSSVAHNSLVEVEAGGGEVTVFGSVDGDGPYRRPGYKRVTNSGNGNITIHGNVDGPIHHSGTGTTTLHGVVRSDRSDVPAISNESAGGGRVIVYGEVQGDISGPVIFMPSSRNNGLLINKETQVN